MSLKINHVVVGTLLLWFFHFYQSTCIAHCNTNTYSMMTKITSHVDFTCMTLFSINLMENIFILLSFCPSFSHSSSTQLDKICLADVTGTHSVSKMFFLCVSNMARQTCFPNCRSLSIIGVRLAKGPSNIIKFPRKEKNPPLILPEGFINHMFIGTICLWSIP